MMIHNGGQTGEVVADKTALHLIVYLSKDVNRPEHVIRIGGDLIQRSNQSEEVPTSTTREAVVYSHTIADAHRGVAVIVDYTASHVLFVTRHRHELSITVIQLDHRRQQ